MFPFFTSDFFLLILEDNPQTDTTDQEKTQKIPSDTHQAANLSSDNASSKPEAEDSDCTCWKKPLIDQVTITDVTLNGLTATFTEASTDQGFFCNQ